VDPLHTKEKLQWVHCGGALSNGHGRLADDGLWRPGAANARPHLGNVRA
jgi:hypothetical protein